MGCQIFLDTIHQNGGKIYQIATKLTNGLDTSIPNAPNIFQVKIDLYCDFGLKLPIPSGNRPGSHPLKAKMLKTNKCV
jgi:hypothetical protein